MPSYGIGLNTLSTARQLIDVAGDNIANANTEGYHAKRAEVVAEIGPTAGNHPIGIGASVESIDRVRNALIEEALLDHVQVNERLGKEVETLANLESLFAEPTGGGLDAQLGAFFDSVSELTVRPDDATLREQVIQKAAAVCDAFNRLDAGFTTMAQNVNNAIQTSVEQINSLTEQISYLNGRISVARTGGGGAPSLEDRRDQLISDLAELINITVYEDEYGVANVSTSGTLIVDGQHHLPLMATADGDEMKLTPVANQNHEIDVREGRLGALLHLSQDLMPRYRSVLDELANDFRRAVNLVHTTSLPLDGRFDSLQGLNVFDTDTPLSETGWGVAAGTDERLIINVEDSATGEVTQFELALDTTQAADAFLAGLRDSINASVDHVSATIDGGRIMLQADLGYAFGFATPYDPNPAAPGDITAATPTSPRILDAYTGQSDLTYEFTFLNGGTIGTDTIDIRIDVREPGGPVLRSLARRIDADYDPGETLTLENGLRYSLGAGDVLAGDGFSFTARASMDTAGVLDALGLNSFINGLGAGGLEVVERVARDNSNLAGALGPNPGDNHRLLDLAAVRQQDVAASGTQSLNAYYRSLIGDIATTRNTREVEYENQQLLVKDLQNRRDAVSGVSMDEEMVGLIRARTLYDAALKYISTMDKMMADIADMI